MLQLGKFNLCTVGHSGGAGTRGAETGKFNCVFEKCINSISWPGFGFKEAVASGNGVNCAANCARLCIVGVGKQDEEGREGGPAEDSTDCQALHSIYADDAVEDDDDDYDDEDDDDSG